MYATFVAVAALPLMLPTIVELTVRPVRVPTDVRLELVIPEASVEPVRVPAAAAPAATPLIAASTYVLIPECVHN